MTPDRVIELLTRDHDRQPFDCGVTSLNDFLKKHARQNAEEDVSRTYVAIRPPSLQVIGYYTLCGGSVQRDDMPLEIARRLPRYPVPVSKLGTPRGGRIAVGARFGRRPPR